MYDFKRKNLKIMKNVVILWEQILKHVEENLRLYEKKVLQLWGKNLGLCKKNIKIMKKDVKILQDENCKTMRKKSWFCENKF